MLLGIYTMPGQGGMQVTGLIPGYSAEGRLFRGDVLLRVAVSEHEVYRVRSLSERENAKTVIGPQPPLLAVTVRPSLTLNEPPRASQCTTLTAISDSWPVDAAPLVFAQTNILLRLGGLEISRGKKYALFRQVFTYTRGFDDAPLVSIAGVCFATRRG
jgi:hypothetical protein